MPNKIFCKFCGFWWLGATLMSFSAWSDTSSLRTREELAQSRPWWVLSTLPKLLGVPEPCQQPFCVPYGEFSMGGHEDEWTGGWEMARVGVRSSQCPLRPLWLFLWPPLHSNTSPGIKQISFFTWCRKCVGQSPEETFQTCLASPVSCLLYLFLPVFTSCYKQVFSPSDSH